MNDVLDFDAAALAEKFRRRELSPVAVTEAYLTRIEDIGEQVNAYITVTADAARTAAGIGKALLEDALFADGRGR